MSRINEIENYLDYFKRLYIQNPQTVIVYDTFYDALSNYGINNPYNSIRNNFEVWEANFKKDNNITVYEHPAQKRFLQFSNTNGVDRDKLVTCYKLYLSFPENIIKDVVEDIFKHMEKRNVTQLSKVADRVRSDAIVLRVLNRKDAEEIINYVNNFKYRNNALPTNPFLPREGIVGYSYDKNLSYNQTLCILLKEYFQGRRNSNTLNQVNYNDFKNFIDYMISKIKTKEGIREIFSDPDFISLREHLKGKSEEEKILNFKQIFETVSNNLNPNYKYQDYLNTVEMYQADYYNNLSLNEIRDIINNQTVRLDPSSVLNGYIIYAAKKYGIYEVQKYLISYINGNDRAITRDNNYRDNFERLLPKESLKNALGSNMQEYIFGVCENYYKKVFENAIKLTINKYGYDHAKKAIMMAINGNYRGFTNDNYARDYLINDVPVEYVTRYANMYLEKINEELGNTQRR